jgi:hypothetical protein
VRQTCDQFEGHGELGACSGKIDCLPRSIELNLLQQLTVHDLKPGMKLQRTTITSTTPRMITTVKTVAGKVWRIGPPNSVILTLEDSTNQSFDIPPRQKFNVDGQETDAWGLRQGMNISATAVTETPETVVSQEVVRAGTEPPPKPDPPKLGATLLIILVPAK